MLDKLKLFKLSFSFIGIGVFALGIFSGVSYGAATMFCTAPTVTAPGGGGTNTINVDCTVSGTAATNIFTLSSDNIVSPTSVTLTSGINTLPSSLGSAVTSPDGTVTAIVGTSNGGFTGTIGASPATLRFTYSVTTFPSTPTGTYSSAANAVSYVWRVRKLGGGGGGSTGSGTASATTSLIIPVVPTAVACSSSSGSAPSGGGLLTLNVDCVITGNQASITPSGSNTFTPTSIVFSNGGNTITGTLQSAITSPNSTVGSIVGTSSGFTGTVTSFPATIRAQYSVTTTSTTPSGTYTSGTITYTWATL